MKHTETIDIKKIGVNGEGIGFLNKKPVFVDQAIPHETVEVTIHYENQKMMKATLEHIIKPARERIKPKCPYFASCGGCDLQHINYSDGLYYKKQHLIQSLKKYMDASFDESLVLDYDITRKPFEYRNKAQLPIRRYQGKNLFGLYMRGTNKFLPIKHCDVHHPLINKVFRTMMELMQEYNVPAYDAQNRKGLIKGMMVRVGHTTDEIQIVILKAKSNNMSQLISAIKKRMPAIVSIYETISQDVKNQDYINETTVHVYGKETIDATLNGYTYSLYPDAFFQLNSIIAESFYEYMIQAAKLKPTDTILDAYAGAATISHVASRYIKKGYAVDLNQDATHSARQSLARHHIENIKVITGDAYQVYKKMKMYMDVVFFDPPRTGLGKRMIDLLSLKKPDKIIYASCNPSTLSKDLIVLRQHYEIISIKPFDMFPQTAQIESVTILKKK